MAITPERREELRKTAKENVAHLTRGRRGRTSPQGPANQEKFELAVPGYGRMHISADSLEEAKQKFKAIRKGDYSIEDIWDVDPGDRLRDPEYAEEHQQKSKAWADWEARISRARYERSTKTGPRSISPIPAVPTPAPEVVAIGSTAMVGSRTTCHEQLRSRRC